MGRSQKPVGEPMSTAGALKGAKIGGAIGAKLGFLPGVGAAAPVIGAGLGALGGALLSPDRKKKALQAALKAETGPGREAAAVAEAANRANIGNQALAPHIIAQGPQAGRSGGRTFAPYSGQKAAENRELVQETIDKAGAETGKAMGEATIAAGDRRLAIRGALEENREAQRAATDEQLFGERDKETGERRDTGLVGAAIGKGGVLDKIADDWKDKNSPVTVPLAEVAEAATGGAPAEAAASGLFKIPGTGDPFEYQKGADGSWQSRRKGSTGGWKDHAKGSAAAIKLDAEAVQTGGAPAATSPAVAAPDFAGARRSLARRVQKRAEEDDALVKTFAGEAEGVEEVDAAQAVEGLEAAQDLKDVNTIVEDLRADFGHLPPGRRQQLERDIDPANWATLSKEERGALITTIDGLFNAPYMSFPAQEL